MRRIAAAPAPAMAEEDTDPWDARMASAWCALAFHQLKLLSELGPPFGNHRPIP